MYRNHCRNSSTAPPATGLEVWHLGDIGLSLAAGDNVRGLRRATWRARQVPGVHEGLPRGVSIADNEAGWQMALAGYKSPPAPAYSILIFGAGIRTAGSNNPKENIAVADAMATYCLPSTAYVIGDAVSPSPIAKCQRCSPVRESTATS